MASPKTLVLRGVPRPVMVMACAACVRRNPRNVPLGGTLQRSERDGLYYHPEHLPERQP